MTPDFDKLKADLNGEEGRRKCVYKDSLGFLTIAVGRLVDPRKAGAGLRDTEMDFMLDNDVREKWTEIADQPWVVACADSEVRLRALLDWYFQLDNHVFGFTMTLQAIQKQDWEQAGKRMRQSLWYKQTPKRAERVIKKIETGED